MSVRINFASVEELQTIPGVGEKLAGLIMSIREMPSVASQLDSIGNALQQRSEAIKSAMQVLNAISSGEGGTREATWRQGSCFSCGKDGHFRRDCPQKQM